MEQPMVKVARLDHDQVFWGLEERALAEVVAGDAVFCAPELVGELPEGALWIERDADNQPGLYRLDLQAKRFMPLPPAQRKAAPGAPTLEEAVYDLITQGKDAPRVKAWLGWMKNSMDGGIR